MKNKLAYSSLTDRVIWVDGKGQSRDVTQNFIQIMLLWLHEGEEMMKPGEKFGRDLIKENDEVDFTIIIERPKSDKNDERSVATEDLSGNKS